MKIKTILITITAFCYTVLLPSLTFAEEFDALNAAHWEYFGADGSVTVQDGLLKINPPSGLYSTYVRSKVPINDKTTAYQIVLRARYPVLNFAGSGFVFGESNPDYPVLMSDPVDSRVLTIWQDASAPLFGVFDKVSLGKFFSILPTRDTNFHEYKITYGSGVYTLFVDNIVKYTSLSDRIIKHLWIGNPGPADSDKPWNSIEVDYLRVSDFEPAIQMQFTTAPLVINDQLPIDRNFNIDLRISHNELGLPGHTISADVIEGSGKITPSIVETDDQGYARFELDPINTGNLHIRFSSGTISKDFNFNVYRPPVVIVPGHGGSFSGKEMLLGIVDPGWHWFTDVALNGWDETLKTLEASGYVENETYTIAFYDWRKSLRGDSPEARDRFLIPAIDAMLQGRPEGQKVNLLAHSFGGLVGRSLVERSSYASKINQLITFGTPHHGSADAYYAWEGGVAAPKGDAFYRSSVFALTHALKKFGGFPSRAAVMRALIPSVQELMPVFSPYLYNNGYIDTASLSVGKNPLLQSQLSTSQFSRQVRRLAIDYTNVVSASHDTIGTIHVEPSDQPNLWEDGRPTGTTATVLGDGTVEAAQVLLGDRYDVYSQAAHGDLPDGTRSLISQKLHLNTFTPAVKEMPKVFFTVMLLSPATAQVFDQLGNEVGEVFDLGDNEHSMIYIADPQQTKYLVRLTGTGNGTYELFANYADQDAYDELSIERVIQAGEVHDIPIIIENDQLKSLQVVETTFKWSPAHLNVRNGVPYSTLEVVLPAQFPVNQLNLSTVKLNNKDITVAKHGITKRGRALEIEIKTTDVLKAMLNKTGRQTVNLYIPGQTHALQASGSFLIPSSLRKWMTL